MDFTSEERRANILKKAEFVQEGAGRFRVCWGKGRFANGGLSSSLCWARFDVIVVDELGGYVDFSQGEVDVLFSFFGERYEKQRSVFITTNLAFSEWEKVFKNPMTATAVVDRIVHHCVLLEFSGKKSIREEEARQRQAAV